MKKKVLTLLGALAALGLAACDPAAPASSAPASNPASSQPAASSKPAESSKPASSKPASSSKPADPVADATGHIWAADTDVAADTEAGTAAFKKAVTTTPATDKAVRYKVNQSVVTYPEGSSRKSDTPEGYTKLSDNGQMLTFKFKSDKLSKGKLYLFGVMDNYSSNTNQGLYYNGSPNVEVKVNNNVVDVSDWANHTYADYLEEGGEGTNSKEGYVPVGDVVLKEGVNEVSYKRVQTRNMLIKDFVFVVEETTEWSDPTTVAADATAGTVAYKKYTNNLDGSIKIEFKALDGTMAEGSENKSGTPDGYLKLKTDGHSISYKFNFDANLDGKFYQRGMMDSYSSNKSCTYYTNSQGKNNEKESNFEFTANAVKVYTGDKRGVTYGTMLGDEANTENSGYSAVSDCEIGDAFIKNGENNITFKRLHSYNLTISEFVFIGKAGNAHTAPAENAEWHMDENSHWQEVANDSFKWNRAENEWERDPEHDVISTACNVDDQLAYKEKTTGETKMVPGPSSAEHAWVAGDKVADVTPSSCSACHKTVYTMLKADAEGDNDTTKKMGKNGPTSTYDITGAIPAGTYDLEFYGKTDGNTAFDFLTRYVVYFGEDVEANYIQPEAGTYASYGWSASGEKWTNKKVATVTVPEGATSMTLKYIGTGYSCFINGMRLVSTAVAAE